MRDAVPALRWRSFRSSRMRRCWLVASAVLALLTGCAGSHHQGNDFQITNRNGFFEFRLGVADNFTMSQNYAWWNPDSLAEVRQGSDIRAGLALVEVRDADGLVVHSRNLKDQGAMATSRGKPGMWAIKVTLDRATGAVQFQLHGK